MKSNSRLSISAELEPHYQLQFSVILRTLLWGEKQGGYQSAEDGVGIFYASLTESEGEMNSLSYFVNFARF